MMDANQAKTAKRTYTKPQVIEVPLVAGEAVLGTCKDAVGGKAACEAKEDLTCTNSTAHS